ncbi:GGDEF domain-containing protein [Quadrisphaera sp. GCM10027208]|uniref:sensor domain-containing diguanylate cyclase n=1 Tax=Quadrisphaera sp. GCM10027208 TaxID=3273423 RepID=UPI00360AC8D9
MPLAVRRPEQVALAVLAAALLGYVVLGASGPELPGVYAAIAVGALVTAATALRRHPPARPRPWRWVLAGMTGWVAGDVVWQVETGLLGVTGFPTGADVLYLAGYLALGVGFLTMVPQRDRRSDVGGLLDAAIVTACVAVPLTVFVLLPAVEDPSLTPLGVVVTAAYPLLDLFLLAVLVRLLHSTGARSAPVWLLTAAVTAELVTDVSYQAWTLATGFDPQSVWFDAGWLLGYLLLAAAMCSRTGRAVTPRPARLGEEPWRGRLAVLGLAGVVPVGTLVVDALTGEPVRWQVHAVAALVAVLLVGARFATLLAQVQSAARELSRLARQDPLTGAPNRRSWDHALRRATDRARRDGRPLSVAMLDLDHFKRFNDEHGHLAGDTLLREAFTAWQDHLGPEHVIARYGGEEFALLFPGTDVSQTRRLLTRLRAVTPRQQTFSAGVARWDPRTPPTTALDAADAALYEAKRRGRDRVVVARTSTDDVGEPPPFEIVVQPVVELATGQVVGYEALPRFAADEDASTAVAAAHEAGYGDLLEAAVLGAALALSGRPEGTDLYVAVSASAVDSARYHEQLPDRLDGVVLGLTADDDVVDWPARASLLDDLRRRGARVAVNGLGDGAGDLQRFLTVRPDVVRLASPLVAGVAGDPGRQRLVAAVARLVAESGAAVCADGVDTAEDLAALRATRVALVQGDALGRAAVHWATGRARQPAAQVGPGRDGPVLASGT